MMRYFKSLTYPMLLVVLCLFSGCDSTGFYAQTIGQEGVPRDHFGHGEAVELVLNGYSGQTVTFYIQSTSTGNTVEQRTEYIPRDWYGIQIPFNLSSGSYFAWAEVGGTRVGSWSFSVR